MGLFDVNENAYVPAKKKGASDRTVDRNNEKQFEEERREIMTRRSKAIMELGNRVYKEWAGKKAAGSLYEDLLAEISSADQDLVMLDKRKLASKGLRKCENCGTELPIASAFCNKCGVKQGDLEPEVVRAGHTCPKCGSTLEDGDMFCTACGYKL
ncbi:MAG: zinc ribbon domain-containing protein [Lachnospiraceae bacterium]|nr:zinc ribbon domain-containing protein [Lachnospiraceae bacterium]